MNMSLEMPNSCSPGDQSIGASGSKHAFMPRLGSENKIYSALIATSSTTIEMPCHKQLLEVAD